MPKDVNIHIKTQGSEDAKRKFDETAKATQRLGGDAQDAGRKAQKGGEGGGIP